MDAMPPMTALWLCRCAQTSAAVLLTGTAALRWLAWGTGAGSIAGAGWRRLAVGSWAVLVAAAAGQLVLTAAMMSGLPLAEATTREVLGSVVDGTQFGAVWLVRVGVLGAMGVGWIVAARGRWWEGTGKLKFATEGGAALLAVGLMGTLVWGGHAGAAGGRGWLRPVDVAHAVAAGAWPGGVVPLAMLLARARRGTGVEPGAGGGARAGGGGGGPGGLVPLAMLLARARRETGGEPGAAVVVVARRFSRLSVGAVGVLALSGSWNAWEMVGTWAGLWTSGYGRLVLAKVALFAVMVGAGAVNRRLVAREAVGESAGDWRWRLWRNVVVEGVLAGFVLLATEALAMSAPPGG